MTSAIIFSKNRAMQLDALLQSIKKYAPFFQVSVIYTHDAPVFAEAYDILKKEHPKVTFIKETHFKNDVIQCLQGEYSLFLCDDDLIFKDIHPITLKDGELCYSIRLGLNITYSYVCNQPQVFKGRVEGDSLVWNWVEAEIDFNFPFSVDGNIFKTEAIKERLLSVEFSNAHLLEYRLSMRHEPLKMIRSATESSLVGIPHNRVHNTIFNSRNAGGSVYNLNEQFLAGKRINPFKMDFSRVNSVHCEIPYVII